MSGHYFDSHIHLEGMSCSRLPELFQKSLTIASHNKFITEELSKVMQRSLKKLERDFQDIHTKASVRSTWSFEQFLTKLYITKLILSTDYELAQQFITEALHEYFQKYDHIRFSLTPSLPFDFPHLDAEQWYKAVSDGINGALSRGKSIHVITETKRQHLNRHVETARWVYQGNLDFITYLLDTGNPNITYSLGICDDENAFPLYDPERLAHLIDYLRASKLNKDIQVTIHTLESGKSRSISPFQQIKELRLLLRIMRTMRIDKATFIHVGNIFSGAEPRPKLRKIHDNSAIQLGLTLLRKVAKRGDTIISCLTSNKRLGNPNILEYPEVVQMMLEENLKITLGTDDPWVFGIRDMDDEVAAVSRQLSKSRIFNPTQVMDTLLANLIH